MKQRDRNDDHQALARPLHVFVLPAPHQAVAGGSLMFFLDRFLGVLDVGSHVDSAQVDVDPGGLAARFSLLITGGPLSIEMSASCADGNLCAGRRGHEHPLAVASRLSRSSRGSGRSPGSAPALPPFGHVHSADGGHDHVLHVAHGQPVARGLLRAVMSKSR